VLGIDEILGAKAAADIGATKRTCAGGTRNERAVKSRVTWMLCAETCAV
jgi:hypothetical protein